MNKKIAFTERNIEDLLKNLSADKKPYPEHLLKARRTTYLSQVTSAVSGGPHHKGENGQGQSGSPTAVAPMTPLMKAVLAVLVTANIALASYLAGSIYDNWDKVRSSLLGDSPVVETSPDIFEIPTSAITPESPAPPEETIVPSETPKPTNPLEATATSGPQVGSSESEVGTPDPNDKNNSGQHLGQTPHSPGNPPGQDNQDNSQNDNQDNNKDKNKDKNP